MTPAELLTELNKRLETARENVRRLSKECIRPDGTDCQNEADVFDKAVELAISTGYEILSEQN